MEPALQTKPVQTQVLFSLALDTLKKLIATPSFSKEEDAAATCIEKALKSQGIPIQRYKNNVWAVSKHFSSEKPTLLLNSHIDTVQPNANYTIDPFNPILEQNKLYGLGSNDAGASLVALLASFIHFYSTDNKYNLVFLASAEEEISGANGITSVIDKIGKIDCAIVGEPTGMGVAVAEKGLMVIDALTTGTAGHAAHPNADQAILKATEAIQQIYQLKFEESAYLGKVNLTVSQINAGTQHNVVPGECHFVIDVRSNGLYTNAELLTILQKNINSQLNPRSTRLNASQLDEEHELVKTAKRLNLFCYGSPTLSDQALMPFPSIKMGPGESSRSHTANEYIYLHELEQGITGYINFLTTLFTNGN
jgi:acetylornithine deacetylase